MRPSCLTFPSRLFTKTPDVLLQSRQCLGAIPSISDAVLFARNRNEALAAMILASLKKLALLKRQAKTFDTAKREIPAKLAHFKRAVEIGNTFAKGGPTELVETIVALCIERADAPAPKMSRIRRRWDEGNLSGETAAVEVRL